VVKVAVYEDEILIPPLRVIPQVGHHPPVSLEIILQHERVPKEQETKELLKTDKRMGRHR